MVLQMAAAGRLAAVARHLGDGAARGTPGAGAAAGDGGDGGQHCVSVSYDELLHGMRSASAQLQRRIEAAYGSGGLGILAVTDVPGLSAHRARMLRLAAEFAALPQDVKQKTETPHASYQVGWSYGNEKLQGDRPDYAKGSYYANPLVERPSEDEELIKAFPSFLEPNVWPSEVGTAARPNAFTVHATPPPECSSVRWLTIVARRGCYGIGTRIGQDLPDFEGAFKDLGRGGRCCASRSAAFRVCVCAPLHACRTLWSTLTHHAVTFCLLAAIVEVGRMVAKQCDDYVASECPGYEAGKLLRLIESSKCCKGRILHYYPADEVEQMMDGIDASGSSSGGSGSSSSSSSGGGVVAQRTHEKHMVDVELEQGPDDDTEFSDWYLPIFLLHLL
jgi:hypothetical protein